MTARNTLPTPEFIRLAGLLTCTELAAELRISPAAVAQRVSRLRAKGLLPRESHRWGEPYWRPGRRGPATPNQQLAMEA